MAISRGTVLDNNTLPWATVGQSSGDLFLLFFYILLALIVSFLCSVLESTLLTVTPAAIETRSGPCSSPPRPASSSRTPQTVQGLVQSRTRSAPRTASTLSVWTSMSSFFAARRARSAWRVVATSVPLSASPECESSSTMSQSPPKLIDPLP